MPTVLEPIGNLALNPNAQENLLTLFTRGVGLVQFRDLLFLGLKFVYRYQLSSIICFKQNYHQLWWTRYVHDFAFALIRVCKRLCISIN